MLWGKQIYIKNKLSATPALPCQEIKWHYFVFPLLYGSSCPGKNQQCWKNSGARLQNAHCSKNQPAPSIAMARNEVAWLHWQCRLIIILVSPSLPGKNNIAMINQHSKQKFQFMVPEVAWKKKIWLSLPCWGCGIDQRCYHCIHWLVDCCFFQMPWCSSMLPLQPDVPRGHHYLHKLYHDAKQCHGRMLVQQRTITLVVHDLQHCTRFQISGSQSQPKHSSLDANSALPQSGGEA